MEYEGVGKNYVLQLSGGIQLFPIAMADVPVANFFNGKNGTLKDGDGDLITCRSKNATKKKKKKKRKRKVDATTASTSASTSVSSSSSSSQIEIVELRVSKRIRSQKTVWIGSSIGVPWNWTMGILYQSLAYAIDFPKRSSVTAEITKVWIHDVDLSVISKYYNCTFWSFFRRESLANQFAVGTLMCEILCTQMTIQDLLLMKKKYGKYKTV